ncbi:MAG: hypothetical protein K0U38_08660 [Epsilonproteobacteria bacterium]|nr:hypothetical protein [Campylobacterota bacterium]
MLKKILLLTIVLFLTSCVQVPQVLTPTTQVNQPHRAKVGYLVNVRAYPTHTHIGTTVLTNFTKNHSFNWQIPTYIEQQLEKELKAIGATAVNLRNYGVKPSEVNGMLKKMNGIWMVSSGKAEAYRNLANNLGLSSVVIINESAKVAVNDCGLLGCKEIKAKGYGLLSHSFVNSNKFFSATAFFAHVYKLKPVESLDAHIAQINHSKEMTLVAVSKGSKVEPNKINFVYPKNFNSWTEQEFKPFRAPLIKYIDGMSKKIAEVIREN